VSDKPKISFVVPTRNRLEWVGECLGSLFGQTIREIEVICVDDGSDDGTATLLRWFASRDARLIVVTNAERLGGGLSRKKGNELARADIIAVCDDDDVYPDERADRILKFFAEAPKGLMMNAPYVQVGYFNEVKENFDGQPFDEDRFKADGSINYFSRPTAAYWREDALAVPYKPETETITDDYQFVTDWIATGRKIGFAPGEYLCMHRVLPKSMMAGHRGFDPAWVK
jgi:glycosyltransferase involved in cell wall biosynthesis